MKRRLTTVALSLMPLTLVCLRGSTPWRALGRDLDWTIAVSTALFWPVVVAWAIIQPRTQRWWRRFEDPSARWGLVIVVALHLVALLAPALVTHSPQAQGHPVFDRYLPPSTDHWMGTDVLGRDLYSRVVYGSRVSLTIGVISVFVSLVLGTIVGGIAGYRGGWLASALMRLTDMMLAFPRLVLLLLAVALFSPSPLVIILILGVTGWMSLARLVRGGVLQVISTEYVDAARALGLPPHRILIRHVLPAALLPIIAALALRVGNTILTESFLSYLGLGLQDPVVSWGMLIRSGRQTLLSAWWLSTFPGLAILLTVLGYNLLGDGLRDAYDPRLRSAVRSEA